MLGLSAAATTATATGVAAGDENDGQDDQPNPVVLKQIAQTVVHSKPPTWKILKRVALLTIILCRSVLGVTTFCRKKTPAGAGVFYL